MDDVLPRPVPDVRIAVTGLRASGVIGAIGVAFLVGMFAVQARIRPQAGRTGDALLVVAVGTIGASSLLQLLLVTGRISFEDEIGPVSVALLLLAVWFVA